MLKFVLYSLATILENVNRSDFKILVYYSIARTVNTMKKKIVLRSGPDPKKVNQVQNTRRSSAAGIHTDRRTRKLRTRATVKNAAISQQF